MPKVKTAPSSNKPKTKSKAKPAKSAKIEYKEIAFVAYPVTDVARARKFYEGVLGLEPSSKVKPDAKWIEYNIGAGTLGIGSSPQWLPSQDGASAALEVVDFEGSVEALKAKRIPFVMGPLDFPSCQMVTIRDPDGNKITLHQRKEH